MENTNIEKQCNAAVPVAERVKQIIFLILAAAFFFVRNHAPGIAVICGVVFAIVWGNPFEKQTAKLTSPLLGAAIVGMGFGMNLVKVLTAGANGIIYTFIGISLGIGLGVFIGKKLGLPKHTLYLISVGTSICGGSAIAAAAPVLKAKASDIAIASAVVFTLNAVALLIFPAIGHALGMTEYQFGTRYTRHKFGCRRVSRLWSGSVGSRYNRKTCAGTVDCTGNTLPLHVCCSGRRGRKTENQLPDTVVHPRIPDRFGYRYLDPCHSKLRRFPERALDSPDGIDPLPDWSKSQPRQTARTRTASGNSRRNPLVHSRRYMVRRNTLRHS